MGILAHSWETATPAPAQTANIVPMHVALLSNTQVLPSQLGEAAYYALEDRPDGQRTLFLRHFGEQRNDTPDLRNATYLDFIANGPRVSGWAGIMRNFWAGFAGAGIKRPTRIVIEYEKPYIWYSMAVTNATRAAEVEAARTAHPRRYPKEFAPYTQAILAAHVNHNSPAAPGIMIHDAMVRRLFNDAIREAVLGTYAEVMGGDLPPTSNYGDKRLRASFTDPYAYVSPVKVLCVGSDSSPDLYFRPDGARFASISGSGPKQFAAMKAMIELVRACRGAVVPWVGLPSYRGDNFDRQTSPSAWVGWRKFIHTLALHGVSEVIYFIGNLDETPEERAYAQETFATATVVRPRAIDRFPKPSIDTNTLETGIGEWVLQQFAYSINDWS